jgi:hypothetical protein
LRETVHGQSNSRRDVIKVIPSEVEEPRNSQVISWDLSTSLETTDCLSTF